MNDLTICCVLRSGGIFDGSWVRRLQRNVARFAPLHRFVCLSDCDVPCERIPLKHDWPRWWPILEVFRPGLFTGRVLYFDLANLIVGKIDPLAQGSGFIIAQAPPDPPPLHGKYASGAMAFDAGDTEIYERFAKAPAFTRLHGDQEWIEEVRPNAAVFDRTLTVSYKGDCLKRGGIPEGAVVIFSHGQPKPPQIADKWFRERWDADY